MTIVHAVLTMFGYGIGVHFTERHHGMTYLPQPSSDHPALATLITAAEQEVVDTEAKLAHLLTDRACSAEQMHDLEVDVQQAHILLDYLRKRATEPEHVPSYARNGSGDAHGAGP